MELKNRFINLISPFTEDTELIDSLWREIDNHYSEKHRTYHNLTHIAELFNYFDIYKQQLENSNCVAFSIFYHDIIYNIWKKDNEEKSALFAIKKLANINLNSHYLDIIHQQIIATKAHFTVDNDTKWMVDFDLGILGQEQKTYDNYTTLIREEYKSVPGFMYKKGRKKVLQHFINKPFIYATNEFRELYEQQAKNNLTNELNSL